MPFSTVSVAVSGPCPQRLFLLLGQSNMAGRGAVESCDLVPHPKVHALGKDLAWQLAIDPIHFDKPDIAGVGLGPSFGRALANASALSSPDIGLIPCAVGDTSLAQWMPDSPAGLFAAAIARSRAALRTPGAKIEAVCWHQGESDADTQNPRDYPVCFGRLIAALRHEFAFPADSSRPVLPVIIGELGRFRAANSGMNAVLSTLPMLVPCCAFVSSQGIGHKGDGLHFDSAGLREFGRRYAAAFQSLESQST